MVKMNKRLLCLCVLLCVWVGLARTGTCVDKHNTIQCKAWALDQQCTKPDWMKQNCQMSCNNCPDLLSCADVLAYDISSTSGVYEVTINGSPVKVYCDMDTLGGGWTVFQYRNDGSEEFNRNLNDYENGFGNYNGEFWLGLQHINTMTAGTTSEIYIEFRSPKFNTDTTVYEVLDNFEVGPSPSYVLSVGNVTSSTDGTPNLHAQGGSFQYNSGYKFSTHDSDTTYNCAFRLRGGFWYNDCTFITPNGDYVTPGAISSIENGWGGIIHYTLSQVTSYKGTKMMFRRH